MTSLGPWTVEAVDAEDIRTLAGVLADPNPIHLDPAAVRELGMGDRLINQGPANLAYIYNMLSEARPDAIVASLKVRFLSNVREGDRVVAAGEVVSGEGDVIECRVWLDVEGGERALEGLAHLQPQG